MYYKYSGYSEEYGKYLNGFTRVSKHKPGHIENPVINRINSSKLKIEKGIEYSKSQLEHYSHLRLGLKSEL